MMKEILNDKNLGRIILIEQFYDVFESRQILNTLKVGPWSDHKILMFGKWITEPRKTAFYADKDVSYSYSGYQYDCLPWTNTLLRIKEKINADFNYYFNSALINYYRDGDDYMGWHRDNEIELGINPHIASLSFGESRDFLFRLKSNPSNKIKVTLQSGDLLLMEDKIQSLWEHSLPKRKRQNNERVNITFRRIHKI